MKGLRPLFFRSKKLKCLVTGATGFVGRELCRQLADCKLSFTAFSRSGGKLTDGTATRAVDFCSGELDRQSLQGVDVVFHLAGIAHQQAEDEAYARVNYLASLALAKAAEAEGVRCFVYLSSVKAMGPPLGEDVRTEDQLSPPRDAYGLSKLRAEQGLQSAFNQSKMSVVILRPALVYGSSVKGNLLLLARAVRVGLPRPPAVGGRSMIAVQDLAGLMCQIAINPPVGFNTWIVCDGQSYSAQLIYDLMRSAAGKRQGMSWLPLWVWRFAALLRDGMRPRGEDSTFLKLFGTELYSSAALMRALSWKPQWKLADAVSGIMTDTNGIKR